MQRQFSLQYPSNEDTKPLRLRSVSNRSYSPSPRAATPVDPVRQPSPPTPTSQPFHQFNRGHRKSLSFSLPLLQQEQVFEPVYESPLESLLPAARVSPTGLSRSSSVASSQTSLEFSSRRNLSHLRTHTRNHSTNSIGSFQPRYVPPPAESAWQYLCNPNNVRQRFETRGQAFLRRSSEFAAGYGKGNSHRRQASTPFAYF